MELANTMHRIACAAAMLIGAPFALAQAQDKAAEGGQARLYRCQRLVLDGDETLSPGAFLVRDGKIAEVGSKLDAGVGVAVVDFGAATVVPGLVLMHTTLEQERDLAERAEAWTPSMRTADAFDPFQDLLEDLARHGITSCVLSPSSDNVAGGIAALVKAGPEFGRVAAEEAYLKLSFAENARDQNRRPTSLMGAVELTQEAMRQARLGVSGGAAARPIRQLLAGQRRAAIHADKPAELLAALRIAREYEIEPVLLGAADAGECMDQIQQQRLSVALRPLRPEMPQQQLALPRELESRGIRFCFLGAPNELRAGAALAVRHGVSRAAALGAITYTAATLAGLQTVGSLRKGRDADFAVYSADPLDLSSSLIATFVDGEPLYENSNKETP
jgi:imidazolonepropionase-like amidohydrolase